MKIVKCSCGGVPEATVYRLAEDLMGARATCKKCGREADEIEHVWGGQEAKEMAYQVWNDMRAEDIYKAKAQSSDKRLSK